jgi:hypothetical protein
LGDKECARRDRRRARPLHLSPGIDACASHCNISCNRAVTELAFAEYNEAYFFSKSHTPESQQRAELAEVIERRLRRLVVNQRTIDILQCISGGEQARRRTNRFCRRTPTHCPARLFLRSTAAANSELAIDGAVLFADPLGITGTLRGNVPRPRLAMANRRGHGQSQIPRSR